MTREYILSLINDKKFEEVICTYEQNIKLDKSSELYSYIAFSYYKIGNWSKAIEIYLLALNLEPNNPYLYSHIGCIYQSKGFFYQAEYFLEKANHFFYSNLATNKYKLGKLDEAFRYIYKAHLLNPLSSEYLNSIIKILNKQNNFNRIKFYQDQLVYLSKKPSLYFFNCANDYSEFGVFEEAINAYKKSIEIDPNNFNSYYGLGILYLFLGNFEEGWKYYELRNMLQLNYYNKIPKFWKGESLENKTIYVHAEQGFGDIFQFSRYFSLLKENKANVIFYCRKQLLDVMKNVKGIDVISSEVEFKEGFHVFLASLPFIFKTTLYNIPNNIPYIKADLELVSKWRKKLSDLNSIKIGFVWKSKGEERRIPLELLTQIFKNEKFSFICLQKDIDNNERKVLESNNVLCLGNDIDNYSKTSAFTDTAAIIENLSLIISADTSVAHLSGSMGKKTWIMLPKFPSWRWLFERNNSPWYPTVRLFRQVNNDWSNVVSEIIQNLHKLE